MSKCEMAANLDIHYDTFIEWEKEHHEFSVAVKQALRCSQAWWEDKGRKATFDNSGANATMFIFNMKNRFKDDWRDKVETEHSGSMTVTGGQSEVAKRFLKRQLEK